MRSREFLVLVVVALFILSAVECKKKKKGQLGTLLESIEKGEAVQESHEHEARYRAIMQATAYSRTPFNVLEESTDAEPWYGLPMKTVKQVQWEQHELDTEITSMFLEAKLWSNRQEPLILKGCDRLKKWKAFEHTWESFSEMFDADPTNPPLPLMHLKEGHIKVHHAEPDSVQTRQIGVDERGEPLRECEPNYTHHTGTSMKWFYEHIKPGRVDEEGRPLTRDDDQWILAVDLKESRNFKRYFQPSDWSILQAPKNVNPAAYVDRQEELLDLKMREDEFVQRLWSGGRNMTAVAHFDWPTNLYVQVYGKKTWVIWRPDLLWSFFTWPACSDSYRHSTIDMEQWASLMQDDKYRLVSALNETAGWMVTLEPGDILFVPECYFHTVIARENSLSVNWFLMDVSNVAYRNSRKILERELSQYPMRESKEETAMMNVCHALHLLYGTVEAVWPGPNPAFDVYAPKWMEGRLEEYRAQLPYATYRSSEIMFSPLAREMHSLSQHTSPKVLHFLDLIIESQVIPVYGRLPDPRPSAVPDLSRCQNRYPMPAARYTAALRAMVEKLSESHGDRLELVLTSLVPAVSGSPTQYTPWLLQEWRDVIRANVAAAEQSMHSAESE